jgi:hypothetical protein
LAAGAVLNGTYTYTVKRNNFDLVRAGQLDLSTGPKTIEIPVAEPAMLYLDLTPAAGTGKDIVAGAAVAPEQLRPSVARPADFDRFWRSKIRLLAAIPMTAAVPVSTTPRSRLTMLMAATSMASLPGRQGPEDFLVWSFSNGRVRPTHYKSHGSSIAPLRAGSP